MESKLAILMADLSGYTALTEVHGANDAADIIDQYLDIVHASLNGKSRLQENTGDQVMIVSPCADDLLVTAETLLSNSQVDQFLEVHGGLHYGPVLQRNQRYFGNTINLTARIASMADAGSIWCSADFRDKISDGRNRFSPRGYHDLKNVRHVKELFAMESTGNSTTFIDPVCKMLIHESGKAIPHPTYSQVYFCGDNCLDIYLASDPEMQS